MLTTEVSNAQRSLSKHATVGLLCHDFRPDSGRGVDRYSFYLGTNLTNFVNVRLVQVGKIKKYPKDWLTKVWRYPFTTMKTKADVFHATSYLDGSVAALTKRRPLVTTIHDLLPLKISEKDYHPTRSPVKDFYESSCIRVSTGSDVIITPFKVYIDDIVVALNYPRDRIRQVYYGVDHDFFQPQIGERKITRKLLYVGGLNQEKGIFDLVAAFRELRKSLDNVSLVIGGRGPHEDRLRHLLAEENLQDHVSLLGFVKEADLPELYRSVDLLIVPAKTGFSLMSLESMSCGTPTIVGDTPDNREVITDEQLRCPIGNYRELVNKIFNILSVDKKITDLSKDVIGLASKYSWRKMASETNSVYTELLKKS